MTMKVKKSGYALYKNWVGRCRNCNSVIDAETIDLKKIEIDTFGEKFSLEDCAYCNRTNSVCFYPYNSRAGVAILRGQR